MQYFADASQKSTWPVVMDVAPACTEAVSVTTVPEVTFVTGLPAEVSARDVVVEGFACPPAKIHGPRTAAATATRSTVLLLATWGRKL